MLKVTLTISIFLSAVAKSFSIDLHDFVSSKPNSVEMPDFLNPGIPDGVVSLHGWIVTVEISPTNNANGMQGDVGPLRLILSYDDAVKILN
jgi:hypothetical protein